MRPAKFGVWRQETVGENMMDPLGQRIPWVVGPSVVCCESRLESKHSVGAGSVDLSLEFGADILRGEEILADQELENGGDQSVATRGVGDFHPRSHLRIQPSARPAGLAQMWMTSAPGRHRSVRMGMPCLARMS